MRILVTGASGFVGHHLFRLLRGRGDNVIAWGKAPNAGADVIAVDMQRPDEVTGHDLRDIDAVVHLAGLAQPSESFKHPLAFISGNASMQLNLMEALLSQGCSPRVLVVSSGGVYAGGAEVITEASPVRPSNPYVISKLTQEMIGAYYGERGLDVVVARPFNHIGPGQRPGYLVSDVASQIVRLERQGGGVLRVGDLDTRRDFTDVRDVASAYVELLSAGKPGEIYNICSGKSRSGREIVKGLTELARAPIDVVSTGELRRPTDTRDVRATHGKLHSETGWLPRIPLERTLEDVLEDWRSAR